MSNMGNTVSKNSNNEIPTAIIIPEQIEQPKQTEQTYFNKNALMYACEHKLENIALKILNTYDGSNIDICDKWGNTALILACKNKLEKVALKILEHPNACNIGHINSLGNTALILACNNKLEKVALKILEYPNECNIGHVNKKGNTALIWACKGKLGDVVLKMLQYPEKCNIDHKSNAYSNKTALEIALEQNLPQDIIIKLLQNSEDIYKYRKIE